MANLTKLVLQFNIIHINIKHLKYQKLRICCESLVGSSPSQLLGDDVTGALREAILVARLPGESATAPQTAKPCLAQASLAKTFRAGREAGEMGTRDDEYDYLFKGGNQNQPFSSLCSAAYVTHTCPSEFCPSQNMAIALYRVI